MRSPRVRVTVDLDRVRAAAEGVRDRTGVDLIAVIKADAYGLGATRVAEALADTAAEFAYFSIAEAAAVARPGVVLGPPDATPEAYRDLGLRPAVGTRAQAERYRGIPCLVNLDTGMQRFGCPADELDALLTGSGAREVFTHAGGPAAIERFAAATSADLRRHAACSSLLDLPAAWFDAVRPGLALYQDAVTVTTDLVAVHTPNGPSGYTGFQADRTGVILVGYSHGLRPAPVRINDRPERTLEIGMNSAFVSVGPDARVGDEVTLLGDALPLADLAAGAGSRPHEVLCRYAGLGPRTYRG